MEQERWVSLPAFFGSFGPGLDDQYMAEIHYRVQVLKVLTVTPDVQLLFDPDLNPVENVITILSIRRRLSYFTKEKIKTARVIVQMR